MHHLSIFAKILKIKAFLVRVPDALRHFNKSVFPDENDIFKTL